MSLFLVISAAQDGYRRGGVALKQGENLLDTEDFTKEQLKQLNEDPRLTIGETVELDPVNEDSEGGNSIPPERLEELVKVIQNLDKDDASLWKQDNAGPKASAFPKGTTAEERDAAWDAFVEQLDGAK